jgi:hypothetical protein
MNDIIPSYFHLNISFFVVLILALVATVYTYYYYRKTVPPVSEKIRIFLGLLRGAAVFLILSLFFSPQIKLVWQNESKPEIVIAVDKSASMQIEDNNQQRFSKAREISDNIQEQIESTNEIHNYYFDVDTSSKSDSVTAGNLGTNIDLALKNLSSKHKNAEAIILISDGIITEGSNPLFSSTLKKFRIHTIGIGDTSDVSDILIKNVIANKTVYKNNPTTISAEITAKNLSDFKTTVKLVYNNKVIAAKQVAIKKSDEIYPVDFEITPKTTGNLRYKIQIDGFESEKFIENNTYQFQLEVLKDKLHVGLLADKPGYDLRFIKQILNSDKSIQLAIFIELNPNTSSVQQILKVIDSSDVIILIDFPGRNTPQSLKNNLSNLIESKRIPVCFLATANPSKNFINIIKKRFPDFSYTASNSFSNVFAVPTISGKLNTVFNIFDSSELNNAFWQNSAPIEYYFNKIQTAKTDKILLQAKDNPNKPVLLSNVFKGLNNLLFLGNGFWRWKFLMAEDRQFSGAYETFFVNLIKWISKNPGMENINIEVNKKGLPLGEQLTANIQLYDASFNPVSDGEIKLLISGPTGEFEATAKNTSNGNYTWEFNPLAEGSYKIKADAYKNDVFLGDNEIEVNVLPVNNEFIFTKQDADFLNKLAIATGGKYFTVNNYKDIIPLLPNTPKIVSTTINYDLWNKLYTLLLIILLLSVEWFIRKRKGLA